MYHKYVLSVNLGLEPRQSLPILLYLFTLYLVFIHSVLFQYMGVHLDFLQFVLQVGQMYMPWHRSRDLWDCLAANPDSCQWDREVWNVYGLWIHYILLLCLFLTAMYTSPQCC